MVAKYSLLIPEYFKIFERKENGFGIFKIPSILVLFVCQTLNHEFNMDKL